MELAMTPRRPTKTTNRQKRHATKQMAKSNQEKGEIQYEPERAPTCVRGKNGEQKILRPTTEEGRTPCYFYFRTNNQFASAPATNQYIHHKRVLGQEAVSERMRFVVDLSPPRDK